MPSERKGSYYFFLFQIKSKWNNNTFPSKYLIRLKCGISEEFLPSQNQKFDVKIEINEQKVYKALDRSLAAYKDEKRGATLILLQSNIDESELKKQIGALNDFPIVKVNAQEKYTFDAYLSFLQNKKINHIYSFSTKNGSF